jgi:hypothetical protein
MARGGGRRASLLHSGPSDFRFYSMKLGDRSMWLSRAGEWIVRWALGRRKDAGNQSRVGESELADECEAFCLVTMRNIWNTMGGLCPTGLG